MVRVCQRLTVNKVTRRLERDDRALANAEREDDTGADALPAQPKQSDCARLTTRRLRLAD